MTMSKTMQRTIAAASLALICAMSSALAQETVRIRGTVERIEGPVYVVKNRDGAEVHIFPESMRGTGEGHYDWDLKPNTKMTNGNVEQSVAAVDGPILSVKYKDGEKKLVVTPETVVVTYVPGNKDEVKPGTKVFVAAKKQADGTFQAPRITYGRNG